MADGKQLRKPMVVILVLIAVPLLFGAKGRRAKDNVICREGFIKIVSPDPINTDQGRRVAKMAMEAWNFDLEQMRWSSSINMNRPLTLRLLSHDRMKREHPGVFGFALQGGNLVVVSTDLLSDPFAKGTLAHELGHTQSFRALGKFSKKRVVPGYFIEGHGLSMGRLYRDHLRVADHKHDIKMAKALTKLTGEEAKIILTNNNYSRGDDKKDFKMHVMGVFFVEYLRVRKGIADAVARMGRVFELVGRGSTYEQAFGQTYGVPVNQVISEVAVFMARTRSTPAERLRKTRYEQFL